MGRTTTLFDACGAALDAACDSQDDVEMLLRDVARPLRHALESMEKGERTAVVEDLQRELFAGGRAKDAIAAVPAAGRLAALHSAELVTALVCFAARVRRERGESAWAPLLRVLANAPTELRTRLLLPALVLSECVGDVAPLWLLVCEAEMAAQPLHAAHVWLSARLGALVAALRARLLHGAEEWARAAAASLDARGCDVLVQVSVLVCVRAACGADAQLAAQLGRVRWCEVAPALLHVLSSEVRQPLFAVLPAAVAEQCAAELRAHVLVEQPLSAALLDALRAGARARPGSWMDEICEAMRHSGAATDMAHVLCELAHLPAAVLLRMFAGAHWRVLADAVRESAVDLRRVAREHRHPSAARAAQVCADVDARVGVEAALPPAAHALEHYDGDGDARRAFEHVAHVAHSLLRPHAAVHAQVVALARDVLALVVDDAEGKHAADQGVWLAMTQRVWDVAHAVHTCMDGDDAGEDSELTRALHALLCDIELFCVRGSAAAAPVTCTDAATQAALDHFFALREAAPVRQRTADLWCGPLPGVVWHAHPRATLLRESDAMATAWVHGEAERACVWAARVLANVRFARGWFSFARERAAWLQSAHVLAAPSRVSSADLAQLEMTRALQHVGADRASSLARLRDVVWALESGCARCSDLLSDAPLDVCVLTRCVGAVQRAWVEHVVLGRSSTLLCFGEAARGVHSVVEGVATSVGCDMAAVLQASAPARARAWNSVWRRHLASHAVQRFGVARALQRRARAAQHNAQLAEQDEWRRWNAERARLQEELCGPSRSASAHPALRWPFGGDVHEALWSVDRALLPDAVASGWDAWADAWQARQDRARREFALWVHAHRRAVVLAPRGHGLVEEEEDGGHDARGDTPRTALWRRVAAALHACGEDKSADVAVLHRVLAVAQWPRAFSRIVLRRWAASGREPTDALERAAVRMVRSGEHVLHLLECFEDVLFRWWWERSALACFDLAAYRPPLDAHAYHDTLRAVHDGIGQLREWLAGRGVVVPRARVAERALSSWSAPVPRRTAALLRPLETVCLGTWVHGDDAQLGAQELLRATRIHFGAQAWKAAVELGVLLGVGGVDADEPGDGSEAGTPEDGDGGGEGLDAPGGDTAPPAAVDAIVSAYKEHMDRIATQLGEADAKRAEAVRRTTAALCRQLLGPAARFGAALHRDEQRVAAWAHMHQRVATVLSTQVHELAATTHA